MSLVHFMFVIPGIYLLFYLIAWLYARKNFPIGK